LDGIPGHASHRAQCAVSSVRNIQKFLIALTTMTLPTKRDPAAQQARLLAQIAEIAVERDALIRALLPLMPTEIQESARASIDSEKNSATTSESTTPPKDEHQLSQVTIDAVLDQSSKTVKQHIELLHAYNGIRDVGHGLMGMIAEQRGVRVKDIMDEFGVEAKD